VYLAGKRELVLHRLLYIVSSGGVHNIKELAQQLDVSEGLVESMIDELARMGYLRLLNAKCGGDCKGCPVASTCAIGGSGRVWMLTEAGHKVAQPHLR